MTVPQRALIVLYTALIEFTHIGKAKLRQEIFYKVGAITLHLIRRGMAFYTG